MSKGTKQQFKQFAINNCTDACLVLGSLISGVIVNIEKYHEYAMEAACLLEETGTTFIPAKDYDDINDKLLYRQREILKLVADHQSSSFSYIDLRPLLEKKGFIKKPLELEITQLLNELLDVRNWTFHNPQSLMVASREAAENNIPADLKGIVQLMPQINPVIIQKVVSYKIEYLVSLVTHTKNRMEQFNRILACMKNDYQELFDLVEPKPLIMTREGLSQKVQYIEQHISSGISDYGSDVSQISMAIQKSKYDGSEEAFNNWVIRSEREN